MTLFNSLQSLNGSMKSNKSSIAIGSSSNGSFGEDSAADLGRHNNNCHPCPPRPICRPCPPPCRPYSHRY